MATKFPHLTREEEAVQNHLVSEAALGDPGEEGENEVLIKFQRSRGIMPVKLQHLKYLSGQQDLRRFLDSGHEPKPAESVPVMEHPHCQGAECSCAKRIFIYRGKRCVILEIPYSSRMRVMEVLP